MKSKNKRKLVILFILTITIVITFFVIFDKRATPVIMSYANVQTKKIAIDVLRSTSLNEVNKRIKRENLYKLEKNNNGEIESIDFNTPLLNETLVIVGKSVRKRLKEIEKGKNMPDEMYQRGVNKNLKKGIIYEVPLGIIFKNSFLSSIGPKIPVKVEYSGNVSLDIKTKVSEYGINSALIQTYIYVVVTQRTILPFRSKDTKISSEIPIIMRVVKGSVPNYLSGSNSSYNLPLE